MVSSDCVRVRALVLCFYFHSHFNMTQIWKLKTEINKKKNFVGFHNTKQSNTLQPVKFTRHLTVCMYNVQCSLHARHRRYILLYIHRCLHEFHIHVYAYNISFIQSHYHLNVTFECYITIHFFFFRLIFFLLISFDFRLH